MSFREMRTFTEMMRSLGYSRIISMENFRTPNFPLVAEILTWLVSRYDAEADLPTCLDTEQDRVIFIKMVAHFMATRACIRLNAKKLYQANGFAVKELLKIAKVLYLAAHGDEPTKDEQLELSVNELLDVSKKKQLQDGRNLASQFASSGASLHALLGREIELRELRDSSIRRQLDSTWVEQCVAGARDALRQQVDKVETSLVNITADETNLDGKIEKKRRELERNRKRLSTLQSVRPAYMEEYEQLEEELSTLYTSYITRFRNLAFLENQYEELMRSELHEMGDSENTFRRIADQLKLNTRYISDDPSGMPTQLGTNQEQDRKDPKYKEGHTNYSAIKTVEEQNDAENDDEDDDDDDEGDDDDDITEEEEEDVKGKHLGKHSYAISGAGEAVGRNQLVPGWSPTGQTVPRASTHGRPKRSPSGENETTGSDENRRTRHGNSKARHYPQKTAGLLESENEDLLLNDDDVEDEEDENEDDNCEVQSTLQNKLNSRLKVEARRIGGRANVDSHNTMERRFKPKAKSGSSPKRHDLMLEEDEDF